MGHNEFSKERNEAWNYLSTHPLGVLATIGGDKTPELALVYFFTEKDFCCYFVTKEDTRKFRNIRERSEATLLCASEEDLTSVELSGQVEVVGDTLEVAKIIEQFQSLVSFRKAGYWVPPIAQLEAGSYVVCRFTPHAVRMTAFPLHTAPAEPPIVHTFTLPR